MTDVAVNWPVQGTTQNQRDCQAPQHALQLIKSQVALANINESKHVTARNPNNDHLYIDYALALRSNNYQCRSNADQPRFPTRSRWGQFASHCNSCSRCWPACTPGRTQQRFHPQMDDEKQNPKAAVWLDLNQQKKGVWLNLRKKTQYPATSVQGPTMGPNTLHSLPTILHGGAIALMNLI